MWRMQKLLNYLPMKVCSREESWLLGFYTPLISCTCTVAPSVLEFVCMSSNFVLEGRKLRFLAFWLLLSIATDPRYHELY